MDSTNYTYQLNAYFGIFYPAYLIDDVLGICSREPKYAKIAGPNAEMTIGKYSYFASTNSDNACSRGFIAVDEMTIEGEDTNEPEHSFLSLEPVKMENLESKHNKAVTVITDLYQILVREFKKNNLPVNQLYAGWQVISCEWDLSESSEEPAPKKGKQAVPTIVEVVPELTTDRPRATNNTPRATSTQSTDRSIPCPPLPATRGRKCNKK